jgi:hypothetical protein
LYVDAYTAFEEIGIIVFLEKRKIPMKTQRITLPIHDLSSRRDSEHLIEQALAQVQGVVHVYINPSIEIAYIEFDPALADPDKFVKVVEDIGFCAGAPSLR